MFGFMFLQIVTAFDVRIRQGSNNELVLGVLYSEKGPKVRLLNSKDIVQGKFIDLFNVTGCRTRLNTKEGFLCGNLFDDKVELCSHQFYKTKFSFKKENTGLFNLVTDKGKCLTKGDEDKWNGGYKLKIKSCKGKPKQSFFVEKIEVGPCKH